MTTATLFMIGSLLFGHAAGRTESGRAAEEPARPESQDPSDHPVYVSFDLNRRAYLGLASAPIFIRDTDITWERLRAEFGIRTEFSGVTRRARLLHRFRFIEGHVVLGPENGFEGVLLHYDWSADRKTAPVRVTTVIGEPRRHDLHLDLGGWLELLRVETLWRAGTRSSFVTIGALQLTLDLWHSTDMSSYLRLRAGGGAELDTVHRFTTVKPQVGIDGDFTLDTAGLHHLRLATEAEKLLFAPEVAGRPVSPARLRLRAGYEVIFLALNEKPLSLILEVQGTWRDDLPDIPPRWEWTGQAGLRFSLGVPARRQVDSF